MILATHGIVASYVGIDADALAFITAANITDTTQQNAIKTLVSDLKSYGIWTKMKAIYPFVGGTAFSHKFNLKDPRDDNGAFRLIFVNGFTHSSFGVQPNGIDAYATTNLIPSVLLSLNSTHLSYYSRTTNGFGTMFSSINSAYNGVIYSIYDTNKLYGRTNRTSATPQSATPTISNSLGLLIQNRNSSTVEQLYQNTTNYDFSYNSSIVPGIPLEIFTYNEYGVRQIFSNMQCSFASIGDGLTNTESVNLHTAVNKFQTTSGRNV